MNALSNGIEGPDEGSLIARGKYWDGGFLKKYGADTGRETGARDVRRPLAPSKKRKQK